MPLYSTSDYWLYLLDSLFGLHNSNSALNTRVSK